MAEVITLHVVTPERRVTPVEGTRAHEVRAPGALGEFGVLAGHASYLSTLKAGEVRVFGASGKVEERVAISGGFALVEGDTVTILADAAERVGEIDVERARRAHTKAEQSVKDLAWGTVEFAQAQAALDRAIARLGVAEREPH